MRLDCSKFPTNAKPIRAAIYCIVYMPNLDCKKLLVFVQIDFCLLAELFFFALEPFELLLDEEDEVVFLEFFESTIRANRKETTN